MHHRVEAEVLLAALKQIGQSMGRDRRAQRISQRAIAKRIGGSQSRVSRWENAKTIPTLREFLLYADACNAPPEKLLEGVAKGVVQMGMELDAEAGPVVNELVRILHRRRIPPPEEKTA